MSFKVVVSTSKDYLDAGSYDGNATSDSDTLFANYAGRGVRQIGGNGGPRRVITANNTATTSTSPDNDDVALGHNPFDDHNWQDTSQLAPEVEEMMEEILTSKPVDPTMDELSEISRPSKDFRPDNDDSDSVIYTKKLKMTKIKCLLLVLFIMFIVLMVMIVLAIQSSGDNKSSSTTNILSDEDLDAETTLAPTFIKANPPTTKEQPGDIFLDPTSMPTKQPLRSKDDNDDFGDEIIITIPTTPSPTTSPTPSPTTSPTPEPTSSPTPEPTSSPTPEPSSSPTPEPTSPPTPEPSSIPTPEPSPEPTSPALPPTHSIIQIGSTLYGSSSNELFGYSLSLSGNGQTLSVGSPYRDAPSHLPDDAPTKNAGAASVYRLSLSTEQWTPYGDAIFGDNQNDWVGWDVPLSSDGEWLAVNGALNSNDPYVKVFYQPGGDGAWMPRGEAVTSNGRIRGFGASLSLSQNGRRLAVGGRRSARVYTFDDKEDDWIMVGTDVKEMANAYVEVSGDGRRVVVGCYGDDSRFENGGRARVFRVDDGRNALEQMGQQLFGNEQDDNFGYSSSLSYDGSVVAIGTYGANYVKIFRYDDSVDVWMPDTGTNGDIVGGGLDPRFGFALSLSENGRRLVVGSPLYDRYSGRAVVYERNDDDDDAASIRWEQIGDDIRGNTNDQMGFSVAMSAEGDYVAVGALKSDENGIQNSGGVRLFRII